MGGGFSFHTGNAFSLSTENDVKAETPIFCVSSNISNFRLTIRSGPTELIDKISKVILSGVVKLVGTTSTETYDIQNAAYGALAQLARKCPKIFNKDLQMLVSYFDHLTKAPTELHDSIREALVSIAPAFRWDFDGSAQSDGDIELRPHFMPNSNQKLLLAMLSEHSESDNAIVQNVVCVFLTTCFPEYYAPARYLLLLMAGER